MKLLVIRHGVAEDREAFAATGQPDTMRPLTDRGRKRMRRGARGLKRVVPKLTVLATSRLVRAAQTADIVSKAYGRMDVATLEELSPERRPDELLAWLRSHQLGDTVAVIGHEPHLGFLVGWLLTGRNDSFVEMKKGGAVLLEFDDPPSGGNAVLAWSIPPRQLRWLGAGA
ncbi:MAG: phosphohistidine phosphatase SixA [Gemmatimonadetes bacterium]|nr:phosphohistidine phosphatase SixA [Gemmatimonadota bacterium]